MCMHATRPLTLGAPLRNFSRLFLQVWLFLDEANTCSHQGLLASIISHRQLPGNRRLHNLVVPLAAINPYRLKPLNSSTASTSGSSSSTSRARAGAGVLATAGLIGKLPSAVKGLGRLVYTVNPLPETAMDHVWWVYSAGCCCHSWLLVWIYLFHSRAISEQFSSPIHVLLQTDLHTLPYY